VTKKLLIIAFLGANFFLSSCAYRIDVQQGNIVTQEMVDKLEIGMSKQKVRFLMGTPLVTDMFHPERWDYAYRLTPGWQTTQQRHLVLIFEGDTLSQINGDLPSKREGAQPQDGAPLPSPEPVL